MHPRLVVAFAVAALVLLQLTTSRQADACCPAGPKGEAVVNADQTVLILWDAATKTQHFIRQAKFASNANDFGFLVPSPTRPELAESGNDAFPYLRKLTEPEIKYQAVLRRARSGDEKKSDEKKADDKFVKVLEQKLVAGFNAAVLETNSTEALVAWLKDNGYAFSPEVEAWAKPYVELRWIITALKVAKDKDRQTSTSVSAAALRMSFKTDRPLFPYREPDSRSAADLLGMRSRLLRIYFIGEARYEGTLTKTQPWTGTVAWSGRMQPSERTRLLEMLKLPADSGPSEWWLTEFEDYWPYRVAEADVYFTRSANQDMVRRPPIIHYYYVDPPSRSETVEIVDQPHEAAESPGTTSLTTILIGIAVGIVVLSVVVVVAVIWLRRSAA